jgi:hypothetical protein
MRPGQKEYLFSRTKHWQKNWKQRRLAESLAENQPAAFHVFRKQNNLPFCRKFVVIFFLHLV